MARGMTEGGGFIENIQAAGTGTAYLVSSAVGTKNLLESTYGVDLLGQRKLSGMQRTSRSLVGVGQVLLTGTVVGKAYNPSATLSGSAQATKETLKAGTTKVQNTVRGAKGLRSAKAARSDPPSGNLIHLTNAQSESRILSSGILTGRRGIFAVPENIATESTGMRILRTGLMPSDTTTFVRVPKVMAGLFKQPVPLGPYSLWKYLGGVRYAPPGSINITKGTFMHGPTLVGPKTLMYGPDVLFWGGVGTYWYNQSQHGGE